MSRPDLDAIESEIRSGYWHLLESEWALLLIAYARHLEDDRIKRIGRINELVMEGERAKNRISELESALEPFSQAEKLGHVPAGLGFLLNNAARVLRKGEQP